MADPTTDDLDPLRAWFATWGALVRARDFAAARALFDGDVSGFGTHAAIVRGQAALEAEQWRQVWPTIADFRFVVEQLHGGMNGEHAWAAVPWTSTGLHPDGTPFPRPGRATVIFVRRDGLWLGVHTHFSLAPGTPGRSYGR
jgi:ketosteroid isomerase-like protein